MLTSQALLEAKCEVPSSYDYDYDYGSTAVENDIDI